MLRYNCSTYQRPTVRCSNPSSNASTVRTPARFPKSFLWADIRESAEKLCQPIAQQNCPMVATILRPPLASRTSSNCPGCGTTTTIIDDRQRRFDIACGARSLFTIGAVQRAMTPLSETDCHSYFPCSRVIPFRLALTDRSRYNPLRNSAFFGQFPGRQRIRRK